MPGFTHLQPAQTVRWSHWLMSHVAAWQRDDMRLRDLMPRVAMLPLGSGTLLLRCTVRSGAKALHAARTKAGRQGQATALLRLPPSFVAWAQQCHAAEYAHDHAGQHQEHRGHGLACWRLHELSASARSTMQAHAPASG